MNVHPAASLFPLLDGPGLDELTEDIRINGLHEPLWMWLDPERGPVLLDGRNRLAACLRLGIRPETRHYTGDDPIGFSVSMNAKRRHLTPGQRDALAADLEPMYAAEAAKRVGGRPASAGKPEADLPQVSERAPQARDRAAKAVGASGRGVAQFKRVEKAAPDLAQRVRAGTLAVDRAERVVRDRESEKRLVEKAKAEAAVTDAPRVDIRLGDFRDVLADLSGVDAIITDPPYPAEFLPLLADLAAWADKVLAPNGVLAVLMGQTHLPEVYRLLDGHRPYRWTGCYLTDGNGYVSHPRKVQSNWKPLLVYGGGPRFVDVVRSGGQDASAKQLHRWGQDYAAFHTIVERLTSAGQTVVDPFMGSGTTLLAAHALGRHTIGCDVAAESVSTARARLA